MKMEDYSRDCALSARDDVEWMEKIVLAKEFNPSINKPSDEWSTLMCCLHLVYDARKKSRFVKCRKNLATHRGLFSCLNQNNTKIKSPAFTIARQCLLDLYVQPTMNCADGRRFLSSAASELDPDFLKSIVDQFEHVCQSTAHKSPSQQNTSKIVLISYMADLLHRMFICISDSAELAPIYYQMIANLEQKCLRAGSSPSCGMFEAYRELLKNINSSKIQVVREFLLNHFFLELTTCSHSPNYRVRENSIRMLEDVFPLVSLDNLPVAEHERQLEDNLEIISRGLEDPNIAVRCASITTASSLIYRFSRIMPTSFLEGVANTFVNKSARDTSSAKIRCALIEAVTHLISQPLVQEFVYQMILPRIGHMLHDMNPKVRLGMAKLIASTAYLDRSNCQFVSPDEIIARLQRDCIQRAIADAKSVSFGGSEVLSRLILGSFLSRDENGDECNLSTKLDKIVELSSKYPSMIPHMLAQDKSSDGDKIKLSAALYLYAFRQMDIHEQRVGDVLVEDWIAAHGHIDSPGLLHSTVLLATSYSLIRSIIIADWSEELATFILNRFNPDLLNFALELSLKILITSPLVAICELILKINICLVAKVKSKELRQRFTNSINLASILEKEIHVGQPMWLLYIELITVSTTDDSTLRRYFDFWINIFIGVRNTLWGERSGSAEVYGCDENRLLRNVLETLTILCSDDSFLSEDLRAEIYQKVLFDFINSAEMAVKGICGADDLKYTAEMAIPHFVDLLRVALSMLLRKKRIGIVGLPDVYQVILQAIGRVRSGPPPNPEHRGVCELCHCMIEALTIICERSKVHTCSLQSLRLAISAWAEHIHLPVEKTFFMNCVQKCLLAHIKASADTNVAEIEDTIVTFIREYVKSVEVDDHRFEFVSLGVCQCLRRQITDEAKRSRVSDPGDDDENENIMSALNANYIDPPYWHDIVRFVSIVAAAYGRDWIAKMLELFKGSHHEILYHLFYALQNFQNVSNKDLALSHAKLAEDLDEDRSEVLKILESVTGQTPQRPILYDNATDLS